MSQTKIDVGMIDATSIGDAKLLQGDGAWVTPAGGMYKLINTATASNSATVSFTSLLTSTYDNYLLTFDDVQIADAANFYLQYSTDNGSSYLTSTYRYHIHGASSQTTSYSGEVSAGDSQIRMTQPVEMSDLKHVMAGRVHIMQPLNAAAMTVVIFDSVSGVSSIADIKRDSGAGGHDTAAAHNAFKVYASSGNVITGNFNLFGQVKSS